MLESLYRPQFGDFHTGKVHWARADLGRRGAVDAHLGQDCREELTLDGGAFFLGETRGTKGILELLEDHCCEASPGTLSIQWGTKETGLELGGFFESVLVFGLVGSGRS